MTPETQTWEGEVLERLRKTYEERGLRFVSHPTRDVTPSFLAGYQPDALALGPHGGVVIEIKRQRQPASELKLAAIADRVAKQHGWEFRVIYANDRTEDTPDIPRPTKEQISQRLAEIERMVRAGHLTPAFVIGWAVMESLTRLLADEGGPRPAVVDSPIQTIQRLAMDGYLDGAAAQRLRDMAGLRNSAVHGDLSVKVARADVEFLLTQIREIASSLV
jgi:REase_AHJR-like